MSHCSKCGGEVDDTSKFCPYCKESSNTFCNHEIAQNEPQSIISPTTQQNSLLHIFSLVICVLLTIIGSVFGLYMLTAAFRTVAVGYGPLSYPDNGDASRLTVFAMITLVVWILIAIFAKFYNRN